MELPTDISIETEEIIFESDHADFLLQELNKDRLGEQVLCDVRFCVGKVEIAAHKSVLGAYSNYYKKMFTCEVKEKYEKDVDTFGISSETLLMIIAFVYTGKITIARDNVYDIFVASDYLDITKVRDFCVRFLKESILLSNCVSMRALARRHNSPELMKATDHFMAVNFNMVTKQEEFKQLSFQDVMAILNQRVSSNEAFMFNAILTWIKHDLVERQKHFEPLFELVNMKKLSTSFLNSLIGEELVKSSQTCLLKIVQQYSGRTSIKHKTPHEFIVFGGKDPSVSKSVQMYNAQTNAWTNMSETRKERVGSCGVFHNKQVFAIGGSWCDSIEAINLNNLKEGWQSVAHLSKVRQYAASVFVNGKICVTGGHSNGGALKSGELFAIKSGTWTSMPNMKAFRVGHAMHEVNGALYCVGGSGLTSMERFDTRANKWMPLASMGEIRDGMASAVCDDGIFVLGGMHTNSVERYDPRNNQWLNMEGMTYPRTYASACCLDGNIYVVGGMGDRRTRFTVEMYNSATDTWKVVCNTRSPHVRSTVLAVY